MTLCFCCSFVPQIWKTYQTKSANDLSSGLLGLTFFGYVSATIHALCNTFDSWLIAGYVVGLILLIILILLKIKYARNTKEK